MAESNSADGDVWRLWIDTGGTFTDCLGLDPEGRFLRLKVLSSSRLRASPLEVDGRRLRLPLPVPGADNLYLGYEVQATDGGGGRAVVSGSTDDWIELDRPVSSDRLELISPEEAPAFAARLLTGTRLTDGMPPISLRLATTKGTNALLERAGDRVVLAVTSGFRDLLRIGDQARPDIFALDIRRPTPFYSRVLEVSERLDAAGVVLSELDLGALEHDLKNLREEGFGALAVALLHSYRNPEHERAVGQLAKELGFGEVSLSSDLASAIKIVPRAQTAVIDAYLSGIVGRYLDGIGSSLGEDRRSDGTQIRVMTSAGGLVSRRNFLPKDSLLSGPAGGVVGAAAAGGDQAWTKLLTFDMGGTSTDVARFDGDFEYRYEQEVGDARVMAPALAIETVAAGGGSLCWIDEDRLRVGPRSAGAQPGPACYGAGGPLAITDVNLLLGRLVPDQFGIPLDVEASRTAALELGEHLPGLDLEEMLAGFLQIANERMADAMRRVSVRRGFDPLDYSMVSFGGAGGQHACGVARELGIRRILIPEDASLLSALGLGRARIERFAESAVLRPLETCSIHLGMEFARLEEEALDQLSEDLLADEAGAIRRRVVELRFVGQDSGLEVDWRGHPDELEADFRQVYRGVFGYVPPDRDIEVASLRVVASSPKGRARGRAPSVTKRETTDPELRRAYFGGRWLKVPGIQREPLSEEPVVGPALVVERHCVTVVDEGWTVRRGEAGGLILEET